MLLIRWRRAVTGLSCENDPNETLPRNLVPVKNQPRMCKADAHPGTGIFWPRQEPRSLAIVALNLRQNGFRFLGFLTWRGNGRFRRFKSVVGCHAVFAEIQSEQLVFFADADTHCESQQTKHDG